MDDIHTSKGLRDSKKLWALQLQNLHSTMTGAGKEGELSDFKCQKLKNPLLQKKKWVFKLVLKVGFVRGHPQNSSANF